jgi:hypothetical protein
MTRLLFCILIIAKFLKEQRRTNLQEGGWSALRGDGGDNMPESRTEAADEIDHLIFIANRIPEVGKLVGERLEMTAILRDHHLTLLKAPELSFNVHGAGEDIVAEHAFNHALDLGRRAVGLHDKAAELGGDGGAEPVDDAIIVHDPLGVGVLRRSDGVDVVAQTKFGEHHFKEPAPLTVVRIGHVEDDQIMSEDVHHFDGGCRSSRRRRRRGRAGAVGAGGSGAVGAAATASVKQNIVELVGGAWWGRAIGVLVEEAIHWSGSMRRGSRGEGIDKEIFALV